ncbi:hypothetical protein GF339_12195 [candidate division KSB3 bacterium]|uniref:Carbohydrate kinase n=1 Tax=candidate division KSB3 bacterium TaxID=2044937 RepID=A0A9D5JWN6_9BACT|nr:hypothetical protein [candidate division KSB3 bacterium]MBD3325341.1 hypothetical protein [candidate division KSB3 bacterium]
MARSGATTPSRRDCFAALTRCKACKKGNRAMSYAGVDIGTNGCKITVISTDGEILHHDARSYTVAIQGDRAELDPHAVWEAFCDLMRQATSQTPHDPITAIAFSILGEAVTPVDRQGQALDQTLISMDYRGKKHSDLIADTLGKAAIYRQTGQPCHPMYPLSKLLWWQEHAPDVFAQTWKFLCWEDFLILKLCGTPVMSHSLASRTLCFDIRERAWSASILDAFGLEDDRLASLVPSGTPVGEVSASMCETLGLPAKTIVVAGGWDQACAALGAGIIAEHLFLESLGTTICVGMCSEQPLLSDALLQGGYQTTCFVKEGSYFLNGGTLNGGILLKWFKEQVKHDLDEKLTAEGRDFYAQIIESLDQHPSDLYFIPHFAGAGTPDFHADSAGGFLNLRYEHTDRDMLQAVIEALCFEVRKNLDFLGQQLAREFAEVRLVGGGSRSPYIGRLTATILQKGITAFDFYDVASFGAALLAFAGVQGWPQTLMVLEAFEQQGRTYAADDIDFDPKYRNYLLLSEELRTLLLNIAQD